MLKNQKETIEGVEIAERIFNLIILDESGSMYGLEKRCVDGVNETIRTIKNAYEDNCSQKQLFSFITFSKRTLDHVPIRVRIYLNEISEVKEFPVELYVPNGSTPLWDAMGIALTELQKKVTERDQVLVTIITDGHENSSKIYSRRMIRDLILRLDAKGWVFTYIGANQDANYESSKLGIKNSLNFCADEEGIKKMWEREKHSRDIFYKESLKRSIGDKLLKEKYFDK